MFSRPSRRVVRADGDARPHSQAKSAAAVRSGVLVDAGIATSAGVLALLLRLPYVTRVPYGWDSVLYIRALDYFNPVIHQPQPPGYLLYVSSARVLHAVIDDPNRALVWVSMLASACAASALYVLARVLYDRLTGIIAAAFLLTSVTFWYYGEVAYPYTTLAAGSIVLALLALAIRRDLVPGTAGVAACTLAFGLIGGFRQDLLPFAAPMFAVAMWRRPLRQWLTAVLAGALGILIWLIPSGVLSGGIWDYLSASYRQGSNATGGSGLSASVAAMGDNVDALRSFLWRGLYLTLPPLLYLLARWAADRRLWRDPANWWVALWVGPPLLFYVVGHVGDYGYTFSVLPGLLVLAARGVVVAGRDAVAVARRALGSLPRGANARRAIASHVALLTLIVGASTMIALGNGYLFVRRYDQLSAAGIRCFNESMEARVAIARQQFPPDQTLIFASAYFQHVGYLLPEYRTWFHDPAQGTVGARTIDPGTQYLVVFDEMVAIIDGDRPPQFETLPCNGKPFYFAAVQPGDVAQYDDRLLTIQISAPRAAIDTRQR